MRSTVAAAILALALAPASVRNHQDQATSASGVILRGRVYSADTGDSIPNARVAVSSRSQSLPPVLTDAEGRFGLRDLPPGVFTLSATRTGYAKQIFGRRITLRAGQAVNDLDIALSRAAAFFGAVVDDLGSPIVDASVVAETVRLVDGRERTTTAAIAQTDDRGEFRIGGLTAGRYVVSVSVGEILIMMGDQVARMVTGDEMRRARVYYPAAATLAQAERFDVRAGDERALAITVALSAPRMGRSGDAGAAAAATVPGSAAVIRGRVVGSDGRPVRFADVQLGPVGGAAGSRTTTDENGAYQLVVAEPAADAYRLAARSRLTMAAYGAGPSGRGDPIQLRPGDVRDHLDITLPSPGVVAGRIVDERGEPVAEVAVHALQVRFVDGRRHLASASSQRVTDDLGRYRLHDLRDGEYLISASVGQIVGIEAAADLPGYATTYYPGSPNAADAQYVTVGAGRETGPIDFALSRGRTARVSGRAITAAGEPVTGGIALMPTSRSRSIAGTQLGARIERDGRFEFRNVPDGDYVLQVVRGRTTSWNEGEFVCRFVTVNGRDITDLELQTAGGSTITGRIVADGTSPPRVDGVEIAEVPVDPDLAPRIGGPPARARMAADGAFELVNVTGPRRLTVSRTPPGWGLKAVLLHGVDVTDAVMPFGRTDQSITDVDVVLTAQIAQISGSVTDARGRGVDDGRVAIFPTDRTLWYPRSRFFVESTPGRAGAFSSGAVPPGDYFVAAIDRAAEAWRADEWQDPDVLDRLSRSAARVTLADGQKVTVALRLR
jgi:carboxypeptidase family protein